MKQVCLFRRGLLVYVNAMRFLAFFGLLLPFVATPVLAAATDWQEVAPGARVRLISSDARAADGSTLAGLEIDMPPGTKTYWRVPGETGIPTMLDLSGSTGVTGHQILWPYPVIDSAAGYLDYVYYGPTVLPVRLTVDRDNPVLDVSVLMGICSDMCMPAQAKFTLPLSFGKADAGQSVRLDQAMANVPLPAADDGVIGDVGFDAAADLLTVPVLGADIDPASVIAAAGDPSVLFGAPQKGPDNGLVVIPLLGGSGDDGLVGQPVQITFMTPTGPYEVTRTVSVAGSTPGHG
jgi:DsbC/DsbD-like thiol-disulfide interchange protein